MNTVTKLPVETAKERRTVEVRTDGQLTVVSLPLSASLSRLKQAEQGERDRKAELAELRDLARLD